MEIVYDQHIDWGRFGEFRYDLVDDHIAVKNGRSGLTSGFSDRPRLTDRVQDREPELLSILLVTRHRQERDPAILARSVRPRP